MNITRPVFALVTALMSLLAGGALVRAQAAAPVAAPNADEAYAVDVKIIEAMQSHPASGEEIPLDPALTALAKDLKSLPFKGYALVDSLQKELKSTEAVSMQFGSPERKRFLRVTAQGKKDGKIRLQLVMESGGRKKPTVDFKSEVSIPEGGTLVVVTKRRSATDRVILLAINGRTLLSPSTPVAVGGTAAQSR